MSDTHSKKCVEGLLELRLQNFPPLYLVKQSKRVDGTEGSITTLLFLIK